MLQNYRRHNKKSFIFFGSLAQINEESCVRNLHRCKADVILRKCKSKEILYWFFHNPDYQRLLIPRSPTRSLCFLAVFSFVFAATDTAYCWALISLGLAESRILLVAPADTRTRTPFISFCSVHLRTLCVARSLSLYYFWSKTWRIARILGHHGLPPSLERGRLTTTAVANSAVEGQGIIIGQTTKKEKKRVWKRENFWSKWGNFEHWIIDWHRNRTGRYNKKKDGKRVQK